MGAVSATDKMSFDFVVAGAGAAGCVVARRLHDAGASVCVLEAGPEASDPAIPDPARALELPFGELDWKYETVPQAEAGDRVIPIASGRVAGGSSSINNTIFARGSRLDFDAWAAAGNAGWSWQEALETYKAMEDFDGGASDLHGTGGPLPVMSTYERHPVMQAFVAAVEQAGVPRNPDYNSGELEGVDFMQQNSKDGTRCSAFDAYLAPVLGSERLTMLTDCTVQRLVFEGRRCVGVEFIRDGELGRVKADREVVLSAGPIGSPKLLLLSGVGPEAHLRDVGVPLLADLPGVGENFQDHAFVLGIWAASKPIPPAESRRTQYQVVAFTRSEDDGAGTNLQFQPIHLPFSADGSGPEHGFTMLNILAKPKSRGTLRLRSADPALPPLIDPAFLSEKADLDALVAAVEQARGIVSQPATSEWLGEELLPGPAVRTSEELRDWVRENVLSFYHPVGTCKMGQGEDAVVDETLSVRGLQGVRVVDASIMPEITAANTHAPSLLIGERGAALAIAASL